MASLNRGDSDLAELFAIVSRAPALRHNSSMLPSDEFSDSTLLMDANEAFQPLMGHETPSTEAEYAAAMPLSGVGTSVTQAPDPGMDFGQAAGLGQFGFEISFPEPRQGLKMLPWSYSVLTQTLFVDINVAFPITFSTARPIPQGAILRATLRYLKAEHVYTLVHRCPNHMAKTDQRAPPSHVLRCDSMTSKYVQDEVTDRLSVVVPILADPHKIEEPLQQQHFFRMMCFSSCPGGLGRRPVGILFTLEHANNVIGKSMLPIRVCACPVRDIRVAENQLRTDLNLAAPNSLKLSLGPLSQLPPLTTKQESDSTSPAALGRIQTITAVCKTRIEDSDDDDYDVIVTGADNTRLVAKIAQALQGAVDPPTLITVRNSLIIEVCVPYHSRVKRPCQASGRAWPPPRHRTRRPRPSGLSQPLPIGLASGIYRHSHPSLSAPDTTILSSLSMSDKLYVLQMCCWHFL